MNRYIILILLVSSSFSCWSQLDRSKLPEAGPAPEIQFEQAETFTLNNGLKVFVVENHKLPRVSFSMILDNDPVLEKENAGYVSMTGQLLRTGTTSKSKAELDEAIDFIGASLYTSSSGVQASSLKKHADKTMALMADVILNPSFPESELDKLKKQTLSAIAANKESVDAIASDVSQVLRYGPGHPYGEVTTEETVNNIDLEEIKSYYNTFFKPNKAYLAVVGDITKEEARKLVTTHLGAWQKGEVPDAEYPLPEAPEEPIVALVDHPSAVQSVINITYPVSLSPGDPDVIRAYVMNQILGGAFSSRLFMNLREKHGYTYGASSSLRSDEIIGSFSAGASVRNEVTDSAVAEFIYELKEIQNGDIKEDELQRVKNYMTGSFARSLESPQTIATFAINLDRYDLPDDYYTNYLKNIAKVTPKDVQEMAEKYIKPENLYIIVVGKAEEIAKGLEAFGKVERYDIYGNSIAKETLGD